MTTKVSDVGATYALNEHQDIQKMLTDLLNDSVAVQRIMSFLAPPQENVSPANLRDRLRRLIQEGSPAVVPGLTSARQTRLRAALNLGAQMFQTQPDAGVELCDPEAAANIFQGMIGWELVEKFVVLALDIQLRLLSSRVLFSGSQTETVACSREIFQFLLTSGATRAIVAHNHPSGITNPSQQDILLTQTLLGASETMGIPILDHIIVGKGSHTSIRAVTALWNP